MKLRLARSINPSALNQPLPADSTGKGAAEAAPTNQRQIAVETAPGVSALLKGFAEHPLFSDDYRHLAPHARAQLVASWTQIVARHA